MTTKIGFRDGRFPFRLWVAASILVATIALSCLRSSLFPLIGDELLTYYTVIQPSLRQLLHFQSTTPIVIEPPAFEILSHICGSLFHNSLLSLRLVSILSLTLIQISLYRIVRPIAGTRAALFSMVLVLNLPVMIYDFLLRPYCMLMAMTIAAFCCWQQAVFGTRYRRLALAGLVISLGLAVTCHFYGILAALPIAIGELQRAYRERRLDKSVVAALVLGSAFLFFDIPFSKAAAPFKEHIPRHGSVNANMIFATYRDMLVPFDHFHLWPPRPLKLFTISVLFTLVFFASFYFSYRRIRSIDSGKYLPVWTALTSLTLLPFLSVFIAYNFTYAYGSRHCCEFTLGFMCLFAISLADVLERMNLFWLSLAALAVVLFVARHYRPRNYFRDLPVAVALYRMPPAMADWMKAHPDQPIYTTLDNCLALSVLGDPKFFPRLRCLYSQDREVKYIHRQASYITTISLAKDAGFPIKIASYEEFREHLPAMLVFSDLETWQAWITESLHEDGDVMNYIDNGPNEHYGGQFYFVTGPPAASTNKDAAR